jgi:PPM family protein phosphatase
MPTRTETRRRRHHAIGWKQLIEIGTATDVGRVREGNEDALTVVELDGGRTGQVVVAVADGMGGHNAGEVASALAVDALRRSVLSAASSASADDLLTEAVALGNQSIWDAAAQDAAKDGMGTTLVCALVDQEGQVVIANVGDSRAYAFLNGETHLVTADHTWVNEQVLAGMMNQREARSSPFRNLLTRTLGNAPRVDVDIFSGLQLEPGDGLVLVSDGVTGYLDESDFSAILSEIHSADAAAKRLVQEAVDRGGADNATAIVLRRR